MARRPGRWCSRSSLTAAATLVAVLPPRRAARPVAGDAREVSDGRAGPGSLARAPAHHPPPVDRLRRRPGAARARRPRRPRTTRMFGLDATFGFGAWYGFLRLRRADRRSPRCSAHSSSGRTPTTTTERVSIPPGPGPDRSAACSLPLLRGRLRAARDAWRCRSLTALARAQVPDGDVLERSRFSATTSCRSAGDKLSRLFAIDLRADGVRRRPLRAEPGAHGRACRPPSSMRAAPSASRLAGDLITRVRLLGADGHRLDAGDLERAAPAGLRARACATRSIHLLGGVLLMAGIAGHDRGDRHRDVRSASIARLCRALADPGRLSRQCRRAAALGLAARCLPRGLVERHGVPVGLHDQDGGLRAAARLSRAPSC